VCVRACASSRLRLRHNRGTCNVQQWVTWKWSASSRVLCPTDRQTGRVHILAHLVSLCVLQWAPHHEDVWGRRGTVPRTVSAGASGRWRVSFALQRPYPEILGAVRIPEPASTLRRAWRRQFVPKPL
jgi:hypothetical protein